MPQPGICSTVYIETCSVLKPASTKRCSCKKTVKMCGPGCTCCNCQNTSPQGSTRAEPSVDEIEAEELQDQYQEELLDDEDFGDDSDPIQS